MSLNASPPETFNNRILVIDDNTAIHEDFRKIFRSAAAELNPLEAARQVMFGASKPQVAEPRYLLDSAYQGLEGLELAKKANEAGIPYALAFIDVRMPPGMDGIETIKAIWKECPELQVAICTAYSDYSWHDMLQSLGSTDNMVIIKKPFDNIEVRQIACALTAKWNLNRERLKEREDLVRARQAAEEANIAKSSFLANMSHEIRTPMNSVIGMIYLLEQTSLSLKQREFATKIDFAANSLLGIINDILDFSKVEAGKITFERIEFNLDEVLSRLVQLTSAQAQKKSIELKITVANNPPKMLMGDPLRLGQVIVNLVSNSLKFTESGEVEVLIKSLKCDNPRDVLLRFEVRDTGIGIHADHVERLFKPFSQSDVSTTRRYGGTGLGLAISRRFVQMMGGDIDVQSTLGAGSTFGFTVQFARGTTTQTHSSMIYTLPAGKRVLVIDADADSRAALCQLLKELSYEAEGAGTCEDAARQIVEMSQPGMRRCNLVLMDCSGPQIHWTEAAMNLRRACGAVNVPPVVLIASGDIGEHHIRVEDIGFDGVLVKPVTRPALFEEIMSVTARHSHSSPARSAPVTDPVLRGAHILLIEDNENNQEIASEVLRLAGCEVSVAATGSQALARLNAAAPQTFSAVLTDIQMPGMDGYETAQAIRATGQFTGMPIVAMTADAIAGTREKCLDAGMNDYLTKPINPEVVYATLSKWLKPRPVDELAPPKTKPRIDGERSVVQPPGEHRLLDITAGMRCVGGKLALYERMLVQFNAKYAQSADTVSAALAAGDEDTARRTLHDLKGMAGTLGAMSLMRAADEWETCLKAGGAAENEAMIRARFRLCLAKTMEAICDATRKMASPKLAQSPAAISKMPPHDTLLLMRNLAQALEKNDMSAEQFAHQLAAGLRESGVSGELIALCENIQRFDFPKALGILKALATHFQFEL